MKAIFTVTILLVTHICYAQEDWFDSLMNYVDPDKLTIQERLGYYHMITEAYAPRDMENTYKYGMIGLEWAKKADNKMMIATFCRYVGSTYAYRTKYDTAHIYQQMQIDIAHEIEDRNLLQNSYFGQGNLYARQAKFDLAIENYQRSMRYYDKDYDGMISHEEALANMHKTYLFYSPHRTYLLSLGNAGECYRRLNNPDKALEYLLPAKELMESGNEWYNNAAVFSQVYRELGYGYFALGDMDSALEHYHKALDIPEGIGYPQESDLKEGMIKVYIVKKEYDKALEYARDCLRVAKELGDPYIDVLAWNSFANIYRAQGRYRDCEAAAMKAWMIDSTSVDTAPVSAFNIAYASLLMGNTEKAEYFFKKNEQFNIEKSNSNFQGALADMEVRYETEKKEMRIASLEKEKELYIWIGIAGVLFAVSLGVVLWQNTRNVRREKQLIATRSVLDGEMGERTRLARDLHDRLSGNLAAVKIILDTKSGSLESVSSKLDSCMEEIRRVSHNLMPASLQFGLKTAILDFTAQFPNVHFHFYGKEQRIEARKEFVLYCCANELVNNSLRHSGAENINVQLVQHKKHITLTVHDDGCGLDQKSAEKGIGMKNIRDRVISCNGRIDILNLPGKGFETTIELKI